MLDAAEVIRLRDRYWRGNDHGKKLFHILALGLWRRKYARSFIGCLPSCDHDEEP